MKLSVLIREMKRFRDQTKDQYKIHVRWAKEAHERLPITKEYVHYQLAEKKKKELELLDASITILRKVLAKQRG